MQSTHGPTGAAAAVSLGEGGPRSNALCHGRAVIFCCQRRATYDTPDTAPFRVSQDKDGHAAPPPVRNPRSGGAILSHVRAHRWEAHEHDGSHPPGVPCEHTPCSQCSRSWTNRDCARSTCLKYGFVDLRGEFRQRIGIYLVHIAPGSVAEGPPLYGRSRRRRDGRILHCVGGGDVLMSCMTVVV